MDFKPLHIENRCQFLVCKSKIIIAGPCSAESEEQVMLTARKLRDLGICMFRAGIWKPRTNPGGFEGVGEQGLPWLQRVQKELGMQVCVEVGNAHHLEKALKSGVDMIWIGARTSTSPFATQEIADALQGVDIPVLVKNPINADLGLWMGALERISRSGVTRLGTIHRGFSAYEKTLYRYPPQWQLPIELRRRLPGITIICDPSHISGRRKLVPAISQHALDLGFDGLMIESHCCPEKALTDASQQLTPDELSMMLSQLILRDEVPSEDLFAGYREHIDRCDAVIVKALAERMQVSRQMGELKRKNNILVLQSARYEEVVSAAVAEGTAKGLSADFLRKLFELIHAESIDQQL